MTPHKSKNKKSALKETGKLKSLLIKSAAGALGIRITQAILGMVISILLARSIGVEGIGSYGAAVAMIQLLLIPIQSGIGSLIGRQIVRLKLNETWDHIRGILFWAGGTTVAYSICVGIGILLASRYFSTSSVTTSLLVAASLFFMAFGRLLSAYFRGLKKVLIAQSYDPLRNLIITLALLVLILSQTPVDLTVALTIFLVSSAASTLIFFANAFRSTPAEVKKSAAAFETKMWFRMAVTFAAINSIMKITDQTGIIIVRSFAGSVEAGLYQVSYQIGNLMLFGLTAVTMTVSPYFTQFHETKDLRRLQTLVTRSTQAAFLFATICAVVLVFAGDKLLGALYGSDFTKAHGTLSLISIAYVIQASTGPSSALLSATGHEGKLLKLSVLAMLTNLATAICLVPILGGLGVAVALLVSMTVLNVGAWMKCQKLLNIDTFALPLKRSHARS